MAFLKPKGRVGIVLPDGILFRDDAAFSYVRRRLVDEFNLSAIVRLPLGAFPFAKDTRTNLLFFSKEPPGKVIRYYQVRLPPGKRAFTKTNPITDAILQGALAWIKKGVADDNSWEVSVADIRANNYDLDLLPPEVSEQLEPAVVAARIDSFAQEASRFADLIPALLEAAHQGERFRLDYLASLGDFVEEVGDRSGDDIPQKFIGVSNTGGLVPFKGSVAKDTKRYRRVEPGDFVYNPMRVNVGSIALCRSQDEAGHASPDYVVFRLLPTAPFDTEYLLRYLQSSIGLRQIQRNAQGTIRSRLYYENLCHIQVPVPAHPEEWKELLSAVDRVRGLLRDLPDIGADALGGLSHALFSLGAP
jgi:type I restriction enzyme M protein